MTREQAIAFATRWADAWNAREVESVLAHFHPDVAFTSPTAAAVVGERTVRGRDALRTYWQTALQRIGSLRFTVDRVVWDADARELAIVYTAEIDGAVRRVSENLTFDEGGRVIAAEVFHGVTGPA